MSYPGKQILHRQSAPLRLQEYIRWLNEEIYKLSDQDVLSKDIDELFAYYMNKHTLDPIVFQFDNKKVELINGKITVVNPERYWGDAADYIQVDGFTFTYHVPYEGTHDLMHYDPEPNVIGKPQICVKEIYAPDACNLGEIQIQIDVPDDQAHENLNGENKFNSIFSPISKRFFALNRLIEEHNKSLPEIVNQALVDRKARAEKFVAISKANNIPIELNPGAPSPNRIPLTKAVNNIVPMPTSKTSNADPTIDNAVYENIKKIIRLFGNTLERTAETFAAFGEDDFRNLFIAHLNSYYTGATGEAFNKTGKTDIRILFDNYAAYIAECKLWNGPKYSILNPINTQLLDYPTWRDGKLSLLIFNKDNKNFPSLLETANSTIESCDKLSSVKRIGANEWFCKLQKDAGHMTFNIQIIIFDLFIG